MFLRSESGELCVRIRRAKKGSGGGLKLPSGWNVPGGGKFLSLSLATEISVARREFFSLFSSSSLLLFFLSLSPSLPHNLPRLRVSLSLSLATEISVARREFLSLSISVVGNSLFFLSLTSPSLSNLMFFRRELCRSFDCLRTCDCNGCFVWKRGLREITT